MARSCQIRRGQLKQKMSQLWRRQTMTLVSLYQISRSSKPTAVNIPKHISTLCVAPTQQQSNPGQVQSASSSRLLPQSAFPLYATNNNRGGDRYSNTRCSSCSRNFISLRKETFYSFSDITATAVTKIQPSVPGPEVEMVLTSEELILEWRYIPLHVNPAVAATLAYLNFMAANQGIDFTFGGTIMKYGHAHLIQCKRGKPQEQNVSTDKDNLMEWTFDFANRPYLSLSDRDAMMTVSRWRYTPLHPDPMTAATLAHLNFDAANKAAGFSFGEIIMQLGREHLEDCISKRAQALRQLQTPQAIPLGTPSNHVCQTAPILSLKKVKVGP